MYDKLASDQSFIGFSDSFKFELLKRINYYDSYNKAYLSYTNKILFLKESFSVYMGEISFSDLIEIGNEINNTVSKAKDFVEGGGIGAVTTAILNPATTFKAVRGFIGGLFEEQEQKKTNDKLEKQIELEQFQTYIETQKI